MNNKKFNLSEKMSQITFTLHRKHIENFSQTDDWKSEDAWRNRLLGFIKSHPELTLKDIKKIPNRRLHLSEELLLGLEKKGYLVITEMEGSEDKVIKLTDLGNEKALSAPDFNDAFDVLSDDEKAIMNDYLDRIKTGLKEKYGDDDISCMETIGQNFSGFRGMFDGMGLHHLRKFHKLMGNGNECKEGLNREGSKNMFEEGDFFNNF